MPDVYKQYRGDFNERPQDIVAFRKQLLYRLKCYGNKEIEILLVDWFTQHSEELSYEELVQFDTDVLNIENPSLIRYLMNGDSLEK